MDSTTITNNETEIWVPKSSNLTVFIFSRIYERCVAYNISDGTFTTYRCSIDTVIATTLSHDVTYAPQCEFEKLMKMYSILSSLASPSNLMTSNETITRIMSRDNMRMYALSFDRDGYLRYNVNLIYQLAKIHHVYMNETTTRKAEELIARFSKMLTDFINSHCGTSIKPIDPTTKNDESYEWLC